MCECGLKGAHGRRGRGGGGGGRGGGMHYQHITCLEILPVVMYSRHSQISFDNVVVSSVISPDILKLCFGVFACINTF